MRLKEHDSRLRSCGEGWHIHLISLNNIHFGKTLCSMSADDLFTLTSYVLSSETRVDNLHDLQLLIE